MYTIFSSFSQVLHFLHFLGGDLSLSKNAMSELCHNLSWQALCSDNGKLEIQFSGIAILTKIQITNYKEKFLNFNYKIKLLKKK